MRDLTDDQLVAVAKAAGEHAAYGELFSRHDSKLRLFLLKRCNEAIVEDVMQETYIKAFVNLAKFRGGSTFSTWLFSIAINEYRQQERKTGIFEQLKARLFGYRELPESARQLDVLLDFEKLSARLNSKQRDAYVLHAVYGCSHREVSERLALPLGSVKSYLAQAETLLRVNES